MKPFFSIERVRNILLVAGLLIFLAVVAFLLSGQWRRRALLQDLPHRLGADIQLQANQFDYTQTRRGKTLFRIHAERAEQTRKNGETVLHHVRIEFYNPNGEREDTIRGDEFEYNQSMGKAVAQGTVEINVRNPSAAPSSAPAVRIRTSGLTFDQKSEIATTSQHLDFQLTQGTGSATGAVYDAANGMLTLQSDVKAQINQRGTPVTIQADHAEMQRAAQIAVLRQMHVNYPSGSADGGLARISFRKDGSILLMHATDGVHMQSADGAQAQSRDAVFQFNEKSQPASGVMTGDAQFRMNRDDHTMKAASPLAKLHFDDGGVLRNVQLQDGAVIDDQQTALSAKKQTSHLSREWRSQTANLLFASVPGASGRSKTHPQLQRMDGDGRVTVTSIAQTDGAVPQTSRLMADHVQAYFSAQGQLARVLGAGHAFFRQINGSEKQWSSQWSSTSDTLDARMMDSAGESHAPANAKVAEGAGIDGGQIQSILQNGHVKIVALRAAPRSGQPVSTVEATAAQSLYEGATEIVHLSGAAGQPPHLIGDSFTLTATKIDLDRAHQNAYAHEAVQATWLANAGAAAGAAAGRNAQSPAHILAEQAAWVAEAQQMTFTGDSSRPVHLWQDANSITAPRIVLNQKLQTLDAVSENIQTPVFTVLAQAQQKTASQAQGKNREQSPSLLRLTSGAVHESYAEEFADFSSGVLRRVTVAATTPDGPATVQSDHVRAFLHLNQPSHATPGSSTFSAVDRILCSGNVRFQSPGRTGSGESLRYTSEDATARLQGDSGHNPTFTDAERGTVSGREIEFYLTDNSVRILDASGITHSGHERK